MLYNASKVYVTQWQPFALPTNGMANPDTWREWAQVRPESGDDHQQLHDGDDDQQHDGGDDQQCDGDDDQQHDGDDDQQHDGGDHHLQLHRQHYRLSINYDNASCCR